MPRNSTGTYSLPESPFVPNTPIASSSVNSDFSDIGDALTGSLSRDGQGGMNAQLGLTFAGFNYTSDPDTSITRSAANTQAITCGGQAWTFSATDLTAPDGSSLLPLIGEIRMWAFATAPTGWLLMRGQACTTTYPLWRAALIAAGNPYGTSGGDPLFPNLQTRVPAGVDVNTGGLDGSGTLGAVLGSQSRTLVQGNLPDYTLPDTLDISDTRVWETDDALWGTGAIGGRAAGAEFSIAAARRNVSAVSGSISQTGSVTLGGSSTPVAVVQPTLIINFIGRAA